MVLVVTMTLSDILNNAATAVLMAPVAVSLAQGISASVDAFLRAVAVGSSCAFLTPIGHQCNTLVLGPGGYRISDYPRIGFLLEMLVLVTALIGMTTFFPLENSEVASQSVAMIPGWR